MPKMSLAVPHALGQEAAIERLKAFPEKLKQKYQGQVSDMQESWAENVLKFGFTMFGFGFKGAVTAEPSDVKLDCDLPFAAMMFKGKIEQEFKDNLSKLLA